MAKGGFMGLVQRYRTPLLIGGGGLVAFTAFQSTRAQGAAAQAAIAAGTLPAGSAPALTPEQTAALIAQGGAQSLAAVQAGLGPTDQALAFGAAMGQGALSAVTGNFSDLAGLAGTALGILPSFAPIAGVTPQPTQPAPTPTPTPPTAVTETFAGYYVNNQPGTQSLFTVNQAGQITNTRLYALAGGYVRARRSTSALLHWRFETGPVSGWSVIPGRSGPFVVYRRYSRSDGTFRMQAIGQTGI